METRKEQSKRTQKQPEAKEGRKTPLERWIEKLEERIAPRKYPCIFN